MSALGEGVARSADAWVPERFEVDYLAPGGAARGAALEDVWSALFEDALPVRRFFARKGQQHLSGLWWSATTSLLPGLSRSGHQEPVWPTRRARRRLGLLETGAGSGQRALVSGRCDSPGCVHGVRSGVRGTCGGMPQPGLYSGYAMTQ
jgi:hypothetical protein